MCEATDGRDPCKGDAPGDPVEGRARLASEGKPCLESYLGAQYGPGSSIEPVRFGGQWPQLPFESSRHLEGGL